MALRHYEIANLVHHYLVKEGYDSVAEFFVTICSHLSGLKSLNNSHQGTKKLPRLFGPSLIDLYEEYLDCKDQLVDELEQLDCVDFRPQDSLPTLLKTLVHQLKQKSKNASTPVPKQTNDASVNTEAEIVSDTSSTQSTPSVSETIPSNDEDVLEPLDLLGAVCDRMLEDTELQVKLAESINKNILNYLDQSKISSDPLLSSTSSHKLDPMLVKAVVEETQADPLFDSIVQDFLGIFPFFINILILERLLHEIHDCNSILFLQERKKNHFHLIAFSHIARTRKLHQMLHQLCLIHILLVLILFANKSLHQRVMLAIQVQRNPK